MNRNLQMLGLCGWSQNPHQPPCGALHASSTVTRYHLQSTVLAGAGTCVDAQVQLCACFSVLEDPCLSCMARIGHVDDWASNRLLVRAANWIGVKLGHGNRSQAYHHCSCQGPGQQVAEPHLPGCWNRKLPGMQPAWHTVPQATS